MSVVINESNRNYRVLLEVTNVLNSQRDTDSLWCALTERLKQVMPWERAGITLYHPEIDAFRFYAVETRMPIRVLQRDAVIPRAGSAFGWVYDHQRPHIRPNLKDQRLFIEDEYYLREGLGRMINLPLLVRESCLGSLNIGSVQTGNPTDEEMEFLQQVATQIALAIDHVRAYEEIDRLRQQLERENEYLQEEIKLTLNFGALVGRSETFQHALALAEAVAATPTTVLITGETGTGKELLARAIHERSARRGKPLVRVNCAALPLGLIESELFGHERGAFTGAEHRRPGRFELAHHGTLFLDEIGEMPPEAQAKLLRVLEDGHVDRVGGTHSLPVDVRVITATNTDLAEAVDQGRFRLDLYHRLHVFPIHLPPLRERPEDVPLLAHHFLELYGIKLKRPRLTLSQESVARLIRYDWPGNIRELQNVIERATVLARGNRIDIDERLLPATVKRSPARQAETLESMERDHILKVLGRTRWRIYGANGAAAVLGLNPSTLRSRLKKLGLRRPGTYDPEPMALEG